MCLWNVTLLFSVDILWKFLRVDGLALLITQRITNKTRFLHIFRRKVYSTPPPPATAIQLLKPASFEHADPMLAPVGDVINVLYMRHPSQV